MKCRHWCHPSVYALWLYDSLVKLQELEGDIAKHISQMPNQQQLDELDIKAGTEDIIVERKVYAVQRS